MSNPTARTGRWGQDRRLEFIDFRLYWEGRLNRSDLTAFFRISVPQASLDLAAYQELAPGNMVYDRTQKTYVAAPTFKPVLTSSDSGHYLNELLWREIGTVAASDSFIGWAPPVASLPSPTRQVDPQILINVIRALQKEEALTVDYRSMTHFDEPTVRTIYPASFAHDGFRWHVRAFCFKEYKFKDFVLGRIASVLDSHVPPSPVPADTEWETFVDVVIGPNPAYSLSKRRAIEHDYQMVKGETKIRARKPQLYYLNRRLNLNVNPGDPVDESQQIVMLRIEEHLPVGESQPDV
ncbi:WYL domain-containing protein [Pseudomonas sp. PDM15]|uniref:WYL domain-containing protein n=1 Tax=Pseudomonas sp. PDM15 TaxID=2769303 RepID=UPI0017854D43|nr:WYL domain-containing protein [Pseudomonas sp. PDM15]MBD9427879.1 WYL domain-containing protein [Pseudomonas sp. PDM15]